MHKPLIFLITLYPIASVYYSSCEESANRECPYLANRTDFLLNLKKGGTDILSTSTYLYDFFLCEEYNYDCGYVPTDSSFMNIANGVSLNMTSAQLSAITTNTATYDKIEPYLGMYGEDAKCGASLFPLTLTAAESDQVLDGYLQELKTRVVTVYDLCRDHGNTVQWDSLNINIRTAILSKLKENEGLLGDSEFWAQVCLNNFEAVSDELKLEYEGSDDQVDLHAAYLIDSVTQQCDKYQSVNFLVDESGSITAPGFALCLQFLEMYINSTNDDFSIMSMHFYASVFAEYITYGHDYDYFLTMIRNKPYASMATYTGAAINESVDRIIAKGFQNGVPQILVVMTDGNSYDDVLVASNRARQNGIIMIAVGITSGINYTQLLQIAENPSNIILIDSYDDLPNLVDFISNYFCKQIITIQLDDVITGNYVRVPTSPSYFRVIKSQQGQYYELGVYFEDDPISHEQGVYQSQVDPFPDQYTEYTTSEYYEIFYEPRISSSSEGQVPVVGADFVPKKIYFIEPENQAEIIVKKDITEDVNASVSYVSVRGVGLGFNISLKSCSTLRCSEERTYYQTQTAAIFDIYDPKSQDLSIYAIIGGTLAALACCCLVFILGIRRLRQEEQEKKKGEKIGSEGKGLTENNTEQCIDENLIPATTKTPIKQEQRSSKSEQESSGSSKLS